MCVRGLDQLPVTDVTFGEFLRGVITADMDLVPDDSLNYRIILADAFRRRGIYDQGWPSMAPDSLRWDPPDHLFEQAEFTDLLDRLDLVPLFDRREIAEQESANRIVIHDWFTTADDSRASTAGDWERLLGIRFGAAEFASINRKGTYPALEIHSARVARRVGPTGRQSRELLIELTQKRFGYFDQKTQTDVDNGTIAIKPKPDFVMRGGSTLVIDLTDGSLRYVIRKRIDDDTRLTRLRDWWLSIRDLSLEATYFGQQRVSEPFALAHRS
jgi:hypothetical protein